MINKTQFDCNRVPPDGNDRVSCYTTSPPAPSTPSVPHIPVQIQAFPRAALTPGANNRADGTLSSALHVRVLHDLALVVANLGLGDGALGVVALALGGGVVGRQDGGRGADDGADLVVELLCLGLLDGGLEGGALLGVGGRGGVGGEGHGGVLGQVVVVVRLCADDGAGLAWHVEVDVWVRGGKDRVGCSDDGADLRHGGCCVCRKGA